MRTQITTLAIATLLSTAAFAQTTGKGDMTLKEASDGSWIGISGTVESSSAGSFALDYGEGTIKVNVDPNATNPHQFIANEAVTVYGILDEGFFKASTINALTVYLDSEMIYTCSSDGADSKVASFVPVLRTGTLIHGRVTKVSGNTFMVDEAGTMITVDTSALNGKAMSEEPKVEVGDRVTVSGAMTKGFFSGRTLEATSMNVMR